MHASYTQPNQSAGKTTPARIMNRLGRHNLGSVALLLGALLVLVPAFAYADVPVATIMGPESVPEPAIDTVETVSFVVTLTDGVGSRPVYVDYSVGGTAAADSDYTAPAAPLTIAPGIRTGTITLTIQADDFLEGDETLVVTLKGATTDAGKAVLGTPKEATTTIKPQGTKTVSVQGPTSPVAEGSAAGFMVSLTGTVSEIVRVRYETVPGSATAADYTAASASGTITLTAETGTTTTFMVDLVDDSLAENDETFTVQVALVDPPADVALGTARATATIQASDDLTVSVATRQNHVIEGSEAMFTVRLAGGVGSQDVVVGYTTELPDAARNPDSETGDFEPPSRTLTIPRRAERGHHPDCHTSR